jgi:hypothetical protein
MLSQLGSSVGQPLISEMLDLHTVDANGEWSHRSFITALCTLSSFLTGESETHLLH